jgi:site-specific DNA-methyltransferase (adenine-specific)
MEKWLNKIICGDCLEVMGELPDKSVDMILCDLPYGTTACKWDTVIPFEPLWEQYERIIKDNGAIVLTASQPFTSALIMSNLKMFRYQWYWNKNKVTGFANAKKQPLRNVEDVVVFYKKSPTYNPQGLIEINKTKRNGKSVGGETLRRNIEDSSGKGSLRTSGHSYVQKYTNYPRQALYINSESKTVHPTQKPVALFEYLVKTYTNPGEVVLDNCAGSCTTAIACLNTDRDYICIEKESKYCDIGRERIGKWHKEEPVNKQVSLF